jgi:TrmH family RNA methyltransferase
MKLTGQAPVLVLQSPQDIVNIASVVRIAKNFGLEQLRLVTPAAFDAYRIEGIAHNTADLVDRIEILETLDEALRDCVYVVALTARARTAKRSLIRPREAAAELVRRSAEGPVAFVAGREDKGLSNEELDRCHALTIIPTTEEYRSLNLAQAVAIMSYEVWLARGGETAPIKPHRHRAGSATADQHERLFADWEKALGAIEFFKTRQSDIVMRSLREIFFRADLDGREATLVRAIGIEIVRYLERKGVRRPEETEPAP